MVPRQEPDPQAIEEELARILTSPEFVASEALSRFLRYVVEETLAGREERLKAYTVAVGAFGRDPDFDPQTDTLVRVHARRLRRALDRYYLTDGCDNPVRIEIRRGSYVPSFSTIVDAPARTGPPGTADRPGAQADGFRLPSILMLPLDADGLQAESVYLADGLTEQIAGALTLYQQLRVIGPLRRARMAQETRSVRELSAEYGADFVLQGAVRQSGTAVKLAISLIDPATRRTLWSESYADRLNPDDWFEFEQRIATRVASTLADDFGVLPRTMSRRMLTRPTQNPQAFDAVLRWNHYFLVLTPDALAAAVQALEQALVVDPHYALPHALLADIYGARYHIEGGSDADLQRCADLVAQARSLDPGCHFAHFMQASLYMIQRKRALFFHQAEQVIQSYPNHAALMGGLGVFLGLWGDWARASALVGNAMALNPHYPGWYHYLFFMHKYRTGDYQAALAETMHFDAPGFYWDTLLRTAVLGQLGETESARAGVAALVELLPATEITLPDLMLRTMLTWENVDHLLEGLTLAGYELTPEPRTPTLPAATEDAA